MLIAEYDYDLDLEVQREEAYAAGEQEGQRKKLLDLVQKKLKKGKSIEAIAEELEESQEEIAKIIEVLKNS